MRRGGGVGYDFSAIRPRGRAGQRHRQRGVGADQLHARLRPVLRHGGVAGARRGAQMGVLRCDHPDIMEFVGAKRQAGRLNNFNISVGVTDALMRAVEADGTFELTHKAEPGVAQIAGGAHRRADGLWVYATIRARELWSAIMRNTYEAAEPGVLFLDRINAENNLHYAERIEATNPCGEIPIPDHGCCCLGSINLTRFVTDAVRRGGGVRFRALRGGGGGGGADARQRADGDGLAAAGAGARGGEQAADRARLHRARRRADPDGAALRQRRGAGGGGGPDAADARRGLSGERGAGAGEGGVSAVRCGEVPRLRQRPAAAGGDPRRDPGARACATATCSSIAPTGTISLAFADNASNGIEPAYSWFYTRKKREPDGSMREYRVEDHAWRLWRARGGNDAAAGVRERAGDLGARPHGDAGGDPALHRRGDLEDGERAGGLSVRGVRGPLPRGLAGGAEGDHHLPAEQRAGRGAVGATRRRISTSPSPTGASGSPTRRRWRWRRCAGRTGRS